MELSKNLPIVASKWMDGDGPEADVVVSSRVRLARNLKDVPFPHMISEEAANKIIDHLNELLANLNQVEIIKELNLTRLEDLSAYDRQILVAKHLISPQMLEKGMNRAVVLNGEETVSIMVNEEDHLRIQCLLPGLQLEEALEIAGQVDDQLEDTVDIAFDEKLGYLTSCPTNVGTGIRASVMMHLPGLMMTQQINRVINAISQVGLTVRGLYGEGTEAHGGLFQVSNQITLGQTEEEIISKLFAVTQQIIYQERTSRQAIFHESKLHLEDKIYRALGTLKNARLMNSQEAMALLSDVRLGLDLGILSHITTKIINSLMVMIQPAYLQKIAGQELGTTERDRKRAEIIRSYFEDNDGKID